jgi:hypothetical protein
MKSETCERYFEDPEGNAGHLETCAECAAFFGELDQPIAKDAPLPPIAVDPAALPLAPWEEAQHRSWPLVVGVALAVIAAASAMFAMAGVSPLAGHVRAFTAQVPHVRVLANVFRLTGNAMPNAPTGWLIGIGVSFIVINAVLFVLLRRAPRGLDA